jgi:hypothetical protein
MKQKLGEENFSHIKYFRFPYGDIGNKSNRGDIHKLITQDYEWKVVGWDLDLSFKHESKHCSSFILEEQIETYLSYNHQTQKDKNIVLFHFKKPDNDCLSSFINFGLNNDCKFLRLDQN